MKPPGPNPRWRDVLPLALAFGWILLLFIAFHPGLMSPDSIGQFSEGLAGDYGNWHPPVVALAYGLAGRLTGSPWPVLLTQLTVLGGGMVLLARAVAPAKSLAALCVLGTYLLAPPIWSIGVTLWKDTLMAAAMLGVVVALRYGRDWQSLSWMTLAVLARHNAIFAVAPLAIYATRRMGERHSELLRYSAAAAAVALLAIAPKLAEKALHARDQWTMGALLVFDEVGVYASHPELLSDSPFADELRAGDLSLMYRPATCQPIFSGEPEVHHLSSASLAPRRAAIVAEWLRVVRAYPSVYARNRLLHFQSLLSLAGGGVCYPFWIGIDPGPWGFHLREHTLLYRGLRRIQEATRDSLLFRTWFWGLALTVLAPVALGRYRHRQLAFWTAISGLAYAAAYLFIGVTCEFRYVYWTVVAVFAVLLLCLEGAGEQASAGEPDGRGGHQGLRQST